MHRTSFVTLATLVVSAAAVADGQPRPAKAPIAAPAPRPVPSPIATPAPPAPPSPRYPVEAPDAPYLELARIKAEAMADLPRQQMELARIKAEATADLPRQQMELARIRAEAMADLPRQQMELEALRYAQIAEAPQSYGVVRALSGGASGYRTEAPAAWAPQDVADSLYREARRALSGDQYERAASLFQRIWRSYPASVYTPDAYYWQAFALQRQGGDRNLGEALASLETQQQKFPKAATRGDANALRNRIEGQLGRRGDQTVASTLRGRAERAANDGCPRADEDERIEALNAVTQMDPERALPILKQVLARREPCTQQLRRTAVMLIARNKQAEVATALMNVAKNDPDREVREQAVFWMANLPGDEAVDLLVALAKSGDDLELRKRAVYSLSRSTSAKAQATLRQLLLDESQPEELRSDALMWVTSRRSSLETGQSSSFLKELYVKNGTISFRQRVLGLMAQTRNEETRAFLVSVALNEREPMELRRSAVLHVSTSAKWGTLNALPRLTGLRSDSSRVLATRADTVRGVASRADSSRVLASRASRSPSGTTVNTGDTVRSGQFTTSGASAAVFYSKGEAATMLRESAAGAAAALASIYDRVGDLELKRLALSSLGGSGEPGIDKLIDVAKNEKNPELRRSAVSYLSRTKDPRALQLLQDIINK